MTYNRMEAKKIPGVHCHFCGVDSVPILKTACCSHWICCDTNFISISGGGRCQDQHERFSLCHSHYSDRHAGPWQDCQVCKDFWSKEEYRDYAEGDHNVPRFVEKI